MKRIPRRALAVTILAASLASASATLGKLTTAADGTSVRQAGPQVGGTRPPGDVGNRVEPADRKVSEIMAMPSSIGMVVTDDRMLTLYRSDKDTPAPSTSTCTDKCLANWRPVLADEKVGFIGGDGSLIGTLTRSDGSKQLTLKGWPLYRFAGDRVMGDTNGQGVDGTWAAVAPDGEKAEPSRPAASGR
jgi:predicted lipoprotein with Yx(FWY)xxD motif